MSKVDRPARVWYKLFEADREQMNSLINSVRKMCGIFESKCPFEWRGWASIAIALFAIHFAVLAFYLIDIPIMDEWDIWYGWTTHGFWPWLWARHNEHVVVTARLHTFLTAWVTGGHPKVLALSGFLVYGLLLYCVYRFCRWTSPNIPSGIIGAFLLFLNSTLCFENHRSGFHSQFHFVLLFLFLAVRQFFRENFGWKNAALGTVYCSLMMVSFATGVAESVVLSTLTILFQILGAPRNWKRLGLSVGSFIIIALMLTAWISGYQRPGLHPPPASPFSAEFVTFVFNLISFGFGFDTLSVAWGALCSALLIIPIFRSRHEFANPRFQALVAIALSLLGAIASIGLGRSPMGLDASKWPRYGEVAMMFIPITVCLWSFSLAPRSRGWNMFCNLLWASLFLTFANNWTLHPYGEYQRAQAAGRECLRSILRSGNPSHCTSLYPNNINLHVQRLRLAEADFLVALDSTSSATPNQ